MPVCDDTGAAKAPSLPTRPTNIFSTYEAFVHRLERQNRYGFHEHALTFIIDDDRDIHAKKVLILTGEGTFAVRKEC